MASTGPGRQTMTGLPAQLEPIQIDPAKTDPFSPPPPPPPTPKLAEVPRAKPVPQPPPPAPTAPPLAWRYWGSMQTPEGQRLLLLARGEQVLPVQVGTQLDDGYVVEAISDAGLRLIYAPLGTVVELPIPTRGITQ